MAVEWSATRLNADVLDLELKFGRLRDDAWIFLASDAHVDSAHCDRATLTEHHRKAMERDAPIFHFGDTFDAMQGKWDKRANQNELRPEHRGNNYLDRLVDTTAEYFAPYAKNIVLFSEGNHEASIGMRHQTVLHERLAQALRLHGGKPFTGPIQGWVRLSLRYGTQRKSLWVCYHHGYGGGGEVTRGMIDNSRTRSQYVADVYYSGHIHRRNFDENVALEPNHNGDIVRRQQLFLRGSSYKFDEQSAWGKSKGMAARPVGGWFLRVTAVPGNRKAGSVADYMIACEAA